MSVSVKFVSMHWAPQVKQNLMDKIEERLEKFGRHRFRSIATMHIDGKHNQVKLHCDVDGLQMTITESNRELGKAVVHVIDRMEATLRKRNNKRKKHKLHFNSRTSITDRRRKRVGKVESEFDVCENDFLDDIDNVTTERAVAS